MNSPSCVPVTFAPHITPHCPAAPWWSLSHITPANLGWYVVAFLVAGTILGWLSDWSRDRWEISRNIRARFRPSRRWYGTHAQVRLRAEADDDDAPRYVVLNWGLGERTRIPWLQVHRLNPEYLTYWDEDAEPFWAPVTVFAPYAVRRFRPGVTVIGRIPVPWLWRYPPLPYPVRVPQDASEAA